MLRSTFNPGLTRPLLGFILPCKYNFVLQSSLFPLNAWNKSLPNCLATLLDTESRLTEKILIGLDFSLEKTPSVGRLKLARSSVHLRIPPDVLTLIGYFKTSILNVLLISRLQILSNTTMFTFTVQPKIFNSLRTTSVDVVVTGN